MPQNKSGNHDRRGFDLLMKVSLFLTALSVIVGLFYSWRVGIATFLLFSGEFIVLQAVSAPPANSPLKFSMFARRAGRRRPVLLCLGDSLTHGNCSASITPDIPVRLCEKMGMPLPDQSRTFRDPLWVVNAGQNNLTSYAVLNERLSSALGCHPDYIVLWIGTNDVIGIYNKSAGRKIQAMNEQPRELSLEGLERNLKQILSFVHQCSPLIQIGVCTLPPLGENLRSEPNKVVRKANEIIEKVVQDHGNKCTVIPVFQRLETIIEKMPHKSMPSSLFPVATLIANAIFHLIPFPLSWNMISMMFGNTVLIDGVHLNERGGDEVVDAITDWLIQTGVAKAIAVKA